jgi:hypothetical protein
MRFASFFCATVIVCSFMTACSRPQATNLFKSTDRYLCEKIGEISSGKIKEASGIAESKRQKDLLWVLNDSGNDAVLYALNTDGRLLTSVKIQKTENVDWEDLASFIYDGRPYLLIADVGDNAVSRDRFMLYVVEEPRIGAKADTSVAVAWSICFSYPDSPRDCEAVAVDQKAEKILLLSKQDVPAGLYELPLRPEVADVVLAARTGEVTTAVRPNATAPKAAPNEQHSQFTAMDISADGSTVAVLTYRRLYLYTRSVGGSWLQALQSKPLIIEYPHLKQAESVCFSADGHSLFMTSEKAHAPILKITLRGAK